MIHALCKDYDPASRIDDKHWQGGFPHPNEWDHLQRKGFDVIVLCAQELQPIDKENVFPGVEMILAPFDDAHLTQHEAEIATKAARLITKRLNGGMRVLVTCQAGRNRSGLVSALTLVMRRKITGKAAMEIVKKNRPRALTNTSFAAFLEGIK